VLNPTTGRPSFSASAISESVPKPPPTATTASDARTTSPLRSSPIPVGTATVTHAFAAERSSPGSSPIVSPPAACAPRHAAAITPPSPPQTTTAPAAASSPPTSSASRSCSDAASPGPTTAMYGVRAFTGPRSAVRAASQDDNHGRRRCHGERRGQSTRVTVDVGGARTSAEGPRDEAGATACPGGPPLAGDPGRRRNAISGGGRTAALGRRFSLRRLRLGLGRGSFAPARGRRRYRGRSELFSCPLETLETGSPPR